MGKGPEQRPCSPLISALIDPLLNPVRSVDYGSCELGFMLWFGECNYDFLVEKRMWIWWLPTI